jgi:chorismate mutase
MENENLKNLRSKVDSIDTKIIELLSERFITVKQIGELKKQLNLPALDMNRWREILKERTEMADKLGLSRIFIESIWNSIHEEALEIEKNV